MDTVESVLADLKSRGKENYRAIFARHGNPIESTYGVSNADLKVIAKSIKGQQDLAYGLYETTVMDAMYLAGIVADGRKMSKELLQTWAESSSGIPMVAEYPVAWVALESPFARELALEWMKSSNEQVASAGWCTYEGLVTTLPDESLDLSEIEGLLATIESSITQAPNRVRACMNAFVIAVGSYVKSLHNHARECAQRMGAVSIDVGDTACKVRSASESIEKTAAAGKVGVKRKTIRC